MPPSIPNPLRSTPMTIIHVTRDDGEARKRAAHRLLESHHLLVLLSDPHALLTGLIGVGTVDDVRVAVPLPLDENPKVFGAVPGALVAASVIRAAGYATTRRADAHARPVVWELADRAAAVAWPPAHPDEPRQVNPRRFTAPRDEMSARVGQITGGRPHGPWPASQPCPVCRKPAGASSR